MKYRTDLALEAMELYRGGTDGKLPSVPGTEYAQKKCGDDITVTTIRILDQEGEKALERKRGNYITLEIDGIADGKNSIKKRAARVLAKEISGLIPFRNDLKVLVVGLGNDKVTPDALGPFSVSKIKVTRHLFLIFDCNQDPEMANVSGLIPGVFGSTGIETAEVIQKAVDLVRPDVVLAVDSLAARDISRVNTTIQLNDTGIRPGSGNGNHRSEISEETVGAKVVAIGVPTVIDAGTLVIDALSGFRQNEGEIEAYLHRNPLDLVVTSTDIDFVIKEFSDIIASGVNIALHPGIYS